MSDKIDFCNKHPNLKLRLPQRKILGGNEYDFDVEKPNTTDYFEKPCKFDYDYKHLVSSKSERCLDASTLPLGRRLELGVDPQNELDRLDKQLFEWNLRNEAKSYDRDHLNKTYQRQSFIPAELKNRSDLKTDYLM